MLAEAGKGDKFIKCFDDTTGKELPWQAGKEAREKELKYLRELGVYDKVHGHVTPVDTKWIDIGKAFVGEPMQIPFTNRCQSVQTWGQARLVCWNSLAGSFESFHIHRRDSQPRVLTDACRWFPCILPCQGPKARVGEIASRRLLRKGRSENRTAEKEYVLYQRCSKQLGTRLPRASGQLGIRAGGAVQEVCSTTGKRKFQTLTHGNDFVATGTKGSLLELQKPAGERVSNQCEHHRGRFDKKHQSTESGEYAGGETGILYQQHSFSILKRLVRYLKGERQWVQVFEVGDMSSEVTVFSDSDWAGEKETREIVKRGSRARGTTPKSNRTG